MRATGRWLLFGTLGALAFVAGMVVGRKQLPPYPQLRALAGLLTGPADSRSASEGDGTLFKPARADDPAQPTAEQAAKIAELEALAYAAGTTPAPARSGVTRHRPGATADGVNLLVDGHAPEARLMDIQGRTLHRWAYPFREAFPASEAPPGADGTGYFRRAALLPEGRLLAIYEGQGLIQLDRDSRLEWAYPGLAHHDLEVAADGSIWVLTREAEILPRIHPDRPVLHDFVVQLDADGSELRRVSIVEAIEASDYSALLALAPRRGDLLHTNTLELLDGRLADRLPAFAAGNALVSMLEIDTIAVIDLETARVVWALTGLWHRQHQPTVLDNGHLLVFDNKGGAGGRSRVLELDPLTQRIVWSYEGGDADPFFTATCGSAQRLANGNTLITESDPGRAFEVTPAGDVVWEYVTPHRAGEDDELIATLFEVVRLPAADLDWRAAGSDVARDLTRADP